MKLTATPVLWLALLRLYSLDGKGFDFSALKGEPQIAKLFGGASHPWEARDERTHTHPYKPCPIRKHLAHKGDCPR